MRIRLALIALALVAGVISTKASADETTTSSTSRTQRVSIFGYPADIPVAAPLELQELPTKIEIAVSDIPIPSDPTIVALATGAPTYAGVMMALRSMTPEQLIRFLWPDNAENRMIAIAKRESGLNCAAKNRHSSAAGLFQTIGIHRARAARMNISWADITGPDCVADAFLAKAIWDDSGFAPWRL